jgi:hypothetical protein
MKRNILLFLSFTWLIVLITVSCKKNASEENTEPSAHNLATKALAHYQSPVIATLDRRIQFTPGKPAMDLTNKQAGAIVVSDVAGGWKGAEWGAKAGTFLGGNTVLGGLAGCVLGAVISSGFTWWQVSGIYDPSFYPYSIPGLIPETYPGANSYSDPLGQVGYLHNKYCKEIFKPGSVNPLPYDAFAGNVVTRYSGGIEADLGADLNFLNHPDLGTLKQHSYAASQIQNYPGAVAFFNSSSTDPVAEAIILSVIERIFQVDEGTDYEVFYLYADEYMNLVNTDDNLTSDQKQKLTMSLNIMKYSAALWQNN